MSPGCTAVAQVSASLTSGITRGITRGRGTEDPSQQAFPFSHPLTSGTSSPAGRQPEVQLWQTAGQRKKVSSPAALTRVCFPFLPGSLLPPFLINKATRQGPGWPGTWAPTKVVFTRAAKRLQRFGHPRQLCFPDQKGKGGFLC